MGASLCELDAVRCAGESCSQNVGLAIDVVGGRDDSFCVAGACLGENPFAQGDDLVVLRKRALEAVY